jgi:hypothetical protein
MKPLSGLRKALITGPFVVGLFSMIYGSVYGVQIARTAEFVSLLVCLVLFGFLIVPYSRSEPDVDPEMSRDE